MLPVRYADHAKQGYIVACLDEDGKLSVDIGSGGHSFQGSWDDARRLNGQKWADLAAEHGYTSEVINSATYLPYALIQASEADDALHADAVGYLVDYVPQSLTEYADDYFWDEYKVHDSYHSAVKVRDQFDNDHERSEPGYVGTYGVFAVLRPHYAALRQ